MRLVARAALHVGDVDKHAWRGKVRTLITLGTPHHGAPLERGGNVVEWLLGATPYSRPLRALGHIRSAGVTDLRYGNIVESDWADRDRFAHAPDPRTPTPLPTGVHSFAIAGTTTSPGLVDAPLASDGIVPVNSALGVHDNPAFHLNFDETRIVYSTSHLDLLSRAEVYALLLTWCGGAVTSTT